MQKSSRPCGVSATKLMHANSAADERGEMKVETMPKENKKIKGQLFGTMRRKLLVSGILSLFLAVLTEALLIGSFYFVYRQLTPDTDAGNVAIQGHVTESNTGAAQGTLFSNTMNNRNFAVPQEPENESDGFFLQALAVIVLQAFLFAVFFYFLTKPYIAYLKELSVEIKGFAKGNLEHKIEVRGEDELAMIAESLNTMAGDLNKMIEHDRRVEARKNELVTNVAHDLRTPLTSILGYLGLAKRPDISAEQKEQYVGTAYEKAKRLEKLIEDLFEYSKMTLGAVRIEKREVDLIRIMQQLLEEFYPSFAENELGLDFYYTDKTAYLYADGNLLARAFANLIGNAVKYGADGKRVEITLSQTAVEVTVKVINFGEIIPNEALDNIFDRFYRVESSRSTQTGGSGLGLTIAKSVIEMHHGTITAVSNLEGTIFTVVLPKDYRAEDNEEGVEEA